jgi:hypothetical protein
MLRPTPLYIVASPNPKVGKTLLARLLIEFAQSSGRRVLGYDLQSRKTALAERFPKFVEPVDISETRGQMQVFDRLLIDRTTTKIIDLGSGAFDQFFSVMEKTDFVRAARQELIEPIVFFVTDAEVETAHAYANLRARLGTATLVPVHNEAASATIAAEDFRASGIDCSPIYIPLLSHLVRRVIDRATFSFARYIKETDGTSELHQWIAPILTKFRELELQIFANRLSLFLKLGIANEQRYFAEKDRV